MNNKTAKQYLSLTVMAGIMLFTSCDKKKTPEAAKGTATVQIANKAGSQTLVLNTGTYLNQNGDTFSVNMYKYYISNIELIREDGSSYKEDYSYHLVDEAQTASKSFQLKAIPAGTYTKMKVVLGVDSTHNVSGAQTGDLDPILGMFWEWNTGYIMAKIEGRSPQSGNTQKIISFHLGGFSGQYSSVKTVMYNLPQALNITATGSPKINIESDILKWFYGSSLINFQNYNAITSVGRFSFEISENYKNHLSVKSIEP
ncbi:hypothetical protein DBR32_14560 [Taibaiella sp. KBW10]|uniref:MbnP family protein n=1 Tax=Taibaiella sp. KBW10 TaxID=2153357 RepID=UPI000F59D77A|nr:MbnP family protein [Taibaiella sp. KBW10]RQO29803.1 hypothetical protein DBR32_14560 [Taibaiella sp. KBW10]